MYANHYQRETNSMAQKALAQSRLRANYINDIDKLIAVADLLEKNPDMKRTTAIRATGISDPTTIRRLRNKLASNHPTKKASRSPAPRVEDALDSHIVALKTISQKHAKKGGGKKKNPPSLKPSLSNKTDPKKNEVDQKYRDKPDILSCIFSANLAAGQALIQMQYKMMSYAFQASPLACYLRSQELIRLTLQNHKAP